MVRATRLSVLLHINQLPSSVFQSIFLQMGFFYLPGLNSAVDYGTEQLMKICAVRGFVSCLLILRVVRSTLLAFLIEYSHTTTDGSSLANLTRTNPSILFPTPIDPERPPGQDAAIDCHFADCREIDMPRGWDGVHPTDEGK